MNKEILHKSIIAFLFIFYTSLAMAQDIEIAKDLHQHHLYDKSKEALISILHNQKSSNTDKAEALSLLGEISFSEGHYTVAFKDWEKLVKSYPQSPQAKEISARLSQLSEITSQSSDAKISSVVAGSYLRNGDFWSHAQDKFTIDTSWLSEIELAIAWYDRVIAEFPGTSAAEVAYNRKLLTLLGWRDGRDAHGLEARSDAVYDKYMPQLIDSFGKLEKSFPDSSYLQGFRYMIAQTYWSHKDWSKTRDWLQKIIESGKGQKTFFTETAKARMQKIEY